VENLGLHLGLVGWTTTKIHYSKLVKFWLHQFKFKFKWNLNRNSNFPPILCDTLAINRGFVCAIFKHWSFKNYTSKFRPHLRHKILCSFSPFPSTHLLLPSSSYPWLPIVVSLFLTHLLLEVASPITFPPSPFFCHWSSRSKGLHWWRRSKAYKLHMELRQ